MAHLVDRIVDVLADFEVTFTAARELVVERISKIREFGLWREMVCDPAHVLDGAVVEEIPHLLADADAPQLLAQADVVGELLLHLVPLGIAMRTVDRPLRGCVRFRLVHQVGHPGGDGLD